MGVQHEFRKYSPHVNNICGNCEKFKGRSSAREESTGRHAISEENTEIILPSYIHKSDSKIDYSCLKILKFIVYTIQLLHGIERDDKPKRTYFAELM